jgi:hypothetical protein
MFDGAFANNQVLNIADAAAVFVSPNAVSEIRVVTGVMRAEFGRNSGSAIMVTPKSGGNDWHGGASESFRNTSLNAANFFLKAAPGGTPKSLPNGTPRNPPWNSNDFDANLGGPIHKDKTFFFVSYLGFRRRQGIVQSAVVPSDAERAAVEVQGTRAARALLALIPRATFGNTLLSSPSDSLDRNEFLTKVDHAVSQANRFSATYFLDDGFGKSPFTMSPIPGFGVTNALRQQNIVLRDSHVFSPRLLHEFRFAFTRWATDSIKPQNRTSLASLGLGAIVPDNPGSEGRPYVVIAGLSVFGNAFNGPQAYKVNNFQILDNVSWSAPRHAVKFGGEIRTFAMNTTIDTFPNGSITIDGSGTATGLVPGLIPGLTPAMNDFANGFATQFRQTSSARVAHRSRTAGLFVQGLESSFRAFRQPGSAMGTQHSLF